MAESNAEHRRVPPSHIYTHTHTLRVVNPKPFIKSEIKINALHLTMECQLKENGNIIRILPFRLCQRCLTGGGVDGQRVVITMLMRCKQFASLFSGYRSYFCCFCCRCCFCCCCCCFCYSRCCCCYSLNKFYAATMHENVLWWGVKRVMKFDTPCLMRFPSSPSHIQR